MIENKGKTGIVTNNSSSVYQSVNVVGVYNPPGTNDPDVVTTETGHVFVAKTPESFTYDDDGNLLSDGRFNYSWDSENRLTSAETLTNLPSAVLRVKVDFVYDYMSRRVGKTVSNWVSNDWEAVELRENNYDGWNLVSEKISNQQSTITNSYTWGMDLSGSLQGAGGIGGLLSAQLGTNSVVYSYDGNGNVSELTDASTGSVKAHYEYSAYGEVLVATGDLATDNCFQFSTKYLDSELGLNYYGYRYYSPSMGRWLNRDPIGERGGRNLYGFTMNRVINAVDPLGLNMDKNIRECLETAVMTITFIPSDLNRGSISANIQIDLNPQKCFCVCKWPKFKQLARSSFYRQNEWTQNAEGSYSWNETWAADNKGNEYYPDAQHDQYYAQMNDTPGAIVMVQARFGFLVELITTAYCTQGVWANRQLMSRKWGLEVKQEWLSGGVHIRSWGDGRFRWP